MRTSLLITARTRRSDAMTNVWRRTGPSARLTPNCAATAPSGSDSNGKSKLCSAEKLRLACSTVSWLMPMRCAPSAANLDGEIAKVTALDGASFGHRARIEEQHDLGRPAR